jgi:tetratricopeptide (TPR) repeat protein
MTGIPRSTIYDRLANGHALDWTFIEKVVKAIHHHSKHLDLDLDDWRRHYDRMLREIDLIERSPIWLGPIVPPADAYQRRDAVTSVDLIEDTGRTYVIQGTGGVGKTQIAAKLVGDAWRERAADLVLWVTATSRIGIISAYADLAEALGMEPGTDPVRVLAKLTDPTCPRWLIIFDDLQDPADIAGLWPPVGNGNVLVTTRRQDSILRSNGRFTARIDEFSSAQSQRFLLERLGVEAAKGADRVATELGHLPLALDLAAAYMIDLHLDSEQFLGRLRARRLEVLDRNDASRTGVTSLWTISAQDADRHEPAGAAGPLLEVAAVLDPNGILVEIFTSSSVRALVAERRGRETPAEDVLDGLSCLERFSLARINDEPRRVVRMHQLLQRAVRESDPARCLAAAKAAADALEQAWPEGEHDRSLIQLLRENVGAVRRANEDALWGDNLHQVVFRAGNSLTRDGLFDEAISYWSELRGEAERRLGEEHPDTLSVRNNLAWSHGRAGDAAKALADLLALLTIRQRVLGLDAVNTLATWHGIAVWRSALGETEAAISVLNDLMNTYLRRLGPDHQDTLNTRLALTDLAGKASPSAATHDLRTLLRDYRRVFGPDHERTWEVETSLIDNLAETGADDESLSRYKRLIASQIRVLGPEHIETLESRFDFANLLGKLGRPGEAAQQMQDLLEEVTRLTGRPTYDLQGLQREIEQWSR